MTLIESFSEAGGHGYSPRIGQLQDDFTVVVLEEDIVSALTADGQPESIALIDVRNPADAVRELKRSCRRCASFSRRTQASSARSFSLR
jgi:hypothetical protein